MSALYYNLHSAGHRIHRDTTVSIPRESGVITLERRNSCTALLEFDTSSWDHLPRRDWKGDC
ncbi:hypothetical protein Plhal710r2_c006g0027901 [Plasmopara halstedii]